MVLHVRKVSVSEGVLVPVNLTRQVNHFVEELNATFSGSIMSFVSVNL